MDDVDTIYENARNAHAVAEPRCAPSDRFEPAGYNVGRCPGCGQLAPVRTASALDAYRRVLVGHPTLDPLAGDAL